LRVLTAGRFERARRFSLRFNFRDFVTIAKFAGLIKSPLNFYSETNFYSSEIILCLRMFGNTHVRARVLNGLIIVKHRNNFFFYKNFIKYLFASFKILILNIKSISVCLPLIEIK